MMEKAARLGRQDVVLAMKLARLDSGCVFMNAPGLR